MVKYQNPQTDPYNFLKIQWIIIACTLTLVATISKGKIEDYFTIMMIYDEKHCKMIKQIWKYQNQNSNINLLQKNCTNYVVLE